MRSRPPSSPPIGEPARRRPAARREEPGSRRAALLLALAALSAVGVQIAFAPSREDGARETARGDAVARPAARSPGEASLASRLARGPTAVPAAPNPTQVHPQDATAPARTAADVAALLRDADPEARRVGLVAAAALAAPGREIVEALARMVVQDAEPLRGAAARTLAAAGSEGATRLLEIARSSPRDPDASLASLDALGPAGAPDGGDVAILVTILGTSEPGHAARAARLLERRASPARADDALLPLSRLATRDDLAARIAARRAASTLFGDERGVVRLLLDGLADPDESGKAVSAALLGRFSDEASLVVPALVASLSARGPARAAALNSLRALGAARPEARADLSAVVPTDDEDDPLPLPVPPRGPVRDAR